MPVYKQPNRTWLVKFRHKTWAGETKWITKRGFLTRREALQWEQDFKLRKSGSIDMLFRDFVQVYCDDKKTRIKESTTVTKANIIDTKLLPYLGEMRLCDITTTDILQWQNEIMRQINPQTGKPFSRSYLKTIHNQLSAILNHAVRFYGLPKNPARSVGNMGSEKGIEMKFWTNEEYQRFSEGIMDEPLAYYCFEVLYWSGIREGELLALTPADIDLKTRTISITKTFQHINGRDLVTDPKTPKSKRKVKIPDFLCDELRDYLRMQYQLKPEDRLFPVTKNYLYRKMKLGCERQSMEKIRIHDLRHSHVSLLISQGYSAVAIADRMGHESIDITYRYAHLFPSAQEKIADTLGKLRKEQKDV